MKRIVLIAPLQHPIDAKQPDIMKLEYHFRTRRIARTPAWRDLFRELHELTGNRYVVELRAPCIGGEGGQRRRFAFVGTEYGFRFNEKCCPVGLHINIWGSKPYPTRPTRCLYLNNDHFRIKLDTFELGGSVVQAQLQGIFEMDFQ